MIASSVILSGSRGNKDLVREGGTYGQDNHTLLQSLIDNNRGKIVTIGDSIDDVIYISKPLILPSNTYLRITGTLKLTDGVVRPLTQDAATGQNRVYVDNSDGAYQVGQWLSVTASNYPTGGGGSVARIMAQAGKVTAATTTYVEFEYNLRTTLSGVSVGDLLVSNSATIGHAQTIFYCRDVNNITITGTGMIDGNYTTMHNYHPCAMGGNTASVAGYETSMGGNGIVFWNCDNIAVRGLSMQEFNIGGILAVEVNTFNFSDLDIYHPYMKHIAFSLGATNGLCEDVTCDTSYNEDGLSLHDLVDNSTFRRFTINDCPRIGLGVGSGSYNNTFENITIDNCNLSIYTYIGSSDQEVHDNTFTDITITRGIAGISLGGVQDTTFTNLNISNGRAGNHCITVGGQCQNITFNGGSCTDTNLISSNSGWGFRTVAKESYHDYESSGITVNDFEFLRLNKALADVGSFPVTFNNCTIDDNDLNGDIDSADFTLNNCTVDGSPYP